MQNIYLTNMASSALIMFNFSKTKFVCLAKMCTFFISFINGIIFIDIDICQSIGYSLVFSLNVQHSPRTFHIIPVHKIFPWHLCPLSCFVFVNTTFQHIRMLDWRNHFFLVEFLKMLLVIDINILFNISNWLYFQPF